MVSVSLVFKQFRLRLFSGSISFFSQPPGLSSSSSPHDIKRRSYLRPPGLLVLLVFKQFRLRLFSGSISFFSRPPGLSSSSSPHDIRRRSWHIRFQLLTSMRLGRRTELWTRQFAPTNW